jgi:hypothetical protein
VALGLYLLAGLVSAAYATDQRLALENVALMVELAVLAMLTSAFASDPVRLRLIGWTICFVALYTAALAAFGLVLFYAGTHTSLIGAYGEQFTPSDSYARVQAGFHSPPLLGSFCIFASAVIARDDIRLDPRLRLISQIALAVLVLATFSRAAIGFAAALMIRAAFRHRDSARIRLAAAVGVVGCLVVIAALTVGRLHLDPSRPESITYEVPDPHNRREAFATSVDTLGEHPIVGEGPGSLPGENDGSPFRAHLTPLNLAATMGLPSLATFVLLIAILWRNRRRPTPIATWSGLAGLGIDALAQDVEHFRHLWVMLGLADADRGPNAPRGSVARRSGPEVHSG